MNVKVYKWCGVPECPNTSIKTPNKLFVFVPEKKSIRDKWLKLARRDLTTILPSTRIYFCEDHFDLPNDMANFMEYHVMGYVSQIRMKPGCMPSKFDCQPDRRKRACTDSIRPYVRKKNKRTLADECEEDLEARVLATKQVELGESSGSSDNPSTNAAFNELQRLSADIVQKRHSSHTELTEKENLYTDRTTGTGDLTVINHVPTNNDQTEDECVIKMDGGNEDNSSNSRADVAAWWGNITLVVQRDNNMSKPGIHNENVTEGVDVQKSDCKVNDTIKVKPEISNENSANVDATSWQSNPSVEIKIEHVTMEWDDHVSDSATVSVSNSEDGDCTVEEKNIIHLDISNKVDGVGMSKWHACDNSAVNSLDFKVKEEKGDLIKPDVSNEDTIDNVAIGMPSWHNYSNNAVEVKKEKDDLNNPNVSTEVTIDSVAVDMPRWHDYCNNAIEVKKEKDALNNPDVSNEDAIDSASVGMPKWHDYCNSAVEVKKEKDDVEVKKEKDDVEVKKEKDDWNGPDVSNRDTNDGAAINKSGWLRNNIVEVKSEKDNFIDVDIKNENIIGDVEISRLHRDNTNEVKIENFDSFKPIISRNTDKEFNYIVLEEVEIQNPEDCNYIRARKELIKEDKHENAFCGENSSGRLLGEVTPKGKRTSSGARGKRKRKIKKSDDGAQGMKDQTLSCDKCSYQTTLAAQFSSHLKAHAASTSYSCELCDYRTINRDHMACHIRVHSGEKPFPCSTCKKPFNRKADLRQHMRIHTGEKPYSCSVCDKSFTRKYHMKKHARIHCVENPFTCTVCGAVFGRKSNLQSHMDIHFGKRFVCDVCDEGFTTMEGLELHVGAHAHEKPFACEVCGRQFVRKMHCLAHQRTHSGEKIYACTVCTNTYYSKTDLKIHLRIHTGEKPYSCNVCDKSFNRSFLLKKHLEKHSGEKQCPGSVSDKVSERGDLKVDLAKET